MQVRRIITGISADGRSTVVADGDVPRSYDFAALPGFSNVTVWSTAAQPSHDTLTQDRTMGLTTLLPEAGGSTFFIVRFPPEAELASADFEAAGAEQSRELPGLADTFDPARPGFHRTPSIDQVIVLEGELCLELEEGDEVALKQGDVVIQNATWHAWHNRTDRPAVIAAISLGLGSASN